MAIAALVLEYLKALVWPITVIFLALFFRKSLNAILQRLIKATLPGGVSLDFKDQIEKVHTFSERVQAEKEILKLPEPSEVSQVGPLIPFNEVNKKLLSLGMEPVKSELNINYFDALADSDPTLAIAALRIELETLAKNVFIGCNIPFPRMKSLTILIHYLERNALIDPSVTYVALQVTRICNRVIHGEKLHRAEASLVIATASLLLETFRRWISSK